MQFVFTLTYWLAIALKLPVVHVFQMGAYHDLTAHLSGSNVHKQVT